MKIGVAIATRGRPAIVARCLELLSQQTRLADVVILSATCADDIAEALALPAGDAARIAYGPAGVAGQRNKALDLATDCDVVVFIDDDFVLFPDALAGVENLFSTRPDIVAATGQVLADGAKGAPIGVEQAERLVRAPRTQITERSVIGLYGCNMAIRMNAVAQERFDEGLPLYGWQEDLDFGARLARRGRVVRTGAFGGVHLGVKGGRHPQCGLGYAQIANPVHLARRSAVPGWYLARLAARNVAANAVGALRGDPWADRRGRLRGNLLALADLATGRIDPERARDL